MPVLELEDNFFRQLNSLKLSLNLRLNQGMSGQRKSSQKGSSVEFSDFREYMLGDDLRRIDWNAYGRFDKLYIKEFMEEKEGLYRIFIDTSKSMDFGENKKSVMALKLAAALSYLVLGNLDRVYVNSLKEDSMTLGKGLSGRNAMKRILAELNNIEFDGKTSLSKSIMSAPIRGKGCSILISDFMDKESLEDGLKYLAYAKQQIVLIEVLSAEELEPAFEGALNLIDVETDDVVKVSMNRKVIESYKERLDEHQKMIARLAKKYMANYVTVNSADDFSRVIFDTLLSTGLLFKK
ncbi:MAG: DUF58 domain-containing protein [Lachnospiraceae bacterium]|nr:DUF58 domain-containing protein [Lachnospiraceae bacterium]